jgi:hypothetical protein
MLLRAPAFSFHPALLNVVCTAISPAAAAVSFLQAFVGGRATSGLVMAALRCLSKGALRQNLSGLRQSTSIYVMIAALIVLTSCLIAGVLLPKLGPQIEAMNQLNTTGVCVCACRPAFYACAKGFLGGLIRQECFVQSARLDQIIPHMLNVQPCSSQHGSRLTAAH